MKDVRVLLAGLSMIAGLRVVCGLLLLTLWAAAQNSAPAPSAVPPSAPPPSAPSASSTAQAPPTTPQGALPIVHDPQPELPYTPLTPEQKFKRFLHSTYAPYTWTSVLFSTTYAQAVGDWYTYGGGMEGYGKRFGATLADTEARNFFVNFAFPTILHQDPRYFPSHKEGIRRRIWYAQTRVAITRNDRGESTFNTSEVVGTLFSKALTNAYYPRRDRGFGETMSNAAGAFMSDAGSNLLREFWPDIRKLFKKHTPERVKKLEERVPKSISDMAGAAAGAPDETPPPPADSPAKPKPPAKSNPQDNKSPK